MYRMAWDAVWFTGSAPRWTTALYWWWRTGNTCFVGTWTGPDRDIICVRRCDTAEEAEAALSPGSRTILGAALKAWWKARRLRRAA